MCTLYKSSTIDIMHAPRTPSVIVGHVLDTKQSKHRYYNGKKKELVVGKVILTKGKFVAVLVLTKFEVHMTKDDPILACMSSLLSYLLAV